MFRIGIIGTENSHALAFGKLINQAGFAEAKVVGVFGQDIVAAQKLADEISVEFVAQRVEDFFGKVDAMMITNRKGSLHYGYAMPFIERKIPVFIDKPLTSNLDEARRLIATAKELGVPLCGGSGCKLATDIEILRNRVRALRESGSFIGGVMNFPADTQSEYDGFYFYAPTW